jgi:hypothetical protein
MTEKVVTMLAVNESSQAGFSLLSQHLEKPAGAPKLFDYFPSDHIIWFNAVTVLAPEMN